MIREMRESDLPALLKMEEVLFPANPWNEEQFLYEMKENPFAHLIVLEEDDSVAGYADYWITYEQAQIADIGVGKEFQGKGYGQKLMDEIVRKSVEAGCENITLEVRVSNVPALGLYEKNGFINAAVRKGYYENGEDAYLLVKPIGG